MPEETITFELIRRIQMEEQRQPKLTKLPDNFFEAVNAYVQQKRQLSLKDDRKFALELKTIERLIRDIFDRREKKILNAAILSAHTDVPPENLTAEEKTFFQKSVESIKIRREENLKKMLGQQREFATLVIFKEDTPEFIGGDEKIYGPFSKGDIANLPEENKKILIERGLVEEFKVSK